MKEMKYEVWARCVVVGEVHIRSFPSEEEAEDFAEKSAHGFWHEGEDGQVYFPAHSINYLTIRAVERRVA